MRTPALACSNWCTSVAQASITCSQLSSTSRSERSLDVLQQRVLDRAAGFLAHAEHRGHRLRHEPRVADRGEFDEPDAVRVVRHDLGRDLQRQARLAHAADAEQREQSRAGELFLDRRELVLAPDERA